MAIPFPNNEIREELEKKQNQLKRAIEIIALNWVAEQKQYAEVTGEKEDVKILDRVRGAILDKLFEFRLSEPKEGEFGIPRNISPVTVTDIRVSGLDNELLWKVLKLFNTGY